MADTWAQVARYDDPFISIYPYGNSLPLSPEDLLSRFSASTPDLTARLRRVERQWETGSDIISGIFHYIAFRDKTPTVSELVSVASDRILSFAIPADKIAEAVEKVRKLGRPDPIVTLVAEARRLFIKTFKETGRSGEFGEILLYMLVEWVLRAPIVACKMYLKTSQQMPVHGTDGIHLGLDLDDKMLTVYWCESKLHSVFSSALGDAIDSIKQHVNDKAMRDNEVRILLANVNLESRDDETVEALASYFDPYNENSNILRERYACLIGFCGWRSESARIWRRGGTATTQSPSSFFFL